jgi:DNA polymerase III alpha subunit (gram-positive type)
MAQRNTIRLVCLDIETTGFNIFHNTIIEIAAKDNLGNKFDTLIYCDSIIPPKIIEITKINNNMLKGAPKIDDALSNLIDFINGVNIGLPRKKQATYLIGHNAVSFDIPFIKAQCIRNNLLFPDIKVLDTMRMSQYIIPNLYSHALKALCSYFNCDNENAHRAMSDVNATYNIFNILCELFNKPDKRFTLDNIHHITSI